MSAQEWMIAIVPLAYAILSVVMEKFPKWKISLDAAVIALIFSLIFSLYYEKFPELMKSTGILYSVGENDLVYTTFKRASEVSHKLDDISDEAIKQVFQTQFRRQLINTSNLLDELAAEKATIAKEDAVSFASTTIKYAQHSVDATSLVEPQSWWLNSNGGISRNGVEYIKLNQSAVERGVRIRRVFILKNESDKISMKVALDANKAAGVEVSIVYIDQIDPSIRQDILIMDNKMAGELILDPETRKYDRFEAVYSKDTVQDYSDRMSRILGQSEKY